MCVCVCVCVALVIQHALRMRHIANCCLLPRPAIFLHIINGTIVEIKLLNVKCMFRYSLHVSSEILLIFRRNERNMKDIYM